MNQVTENAEEILEGEIVTPQKKQRLFGNLSALTDYIRVFNIQNGAYGVSNQNGLNVFVLEYYTQE